MLLAVGAFLGSVCELRMDVKDRRGREGVDIRVTDEKELSRSRREPLLLGVSISSCFGRVDCGVLIEERLGDLPDVLERAGDFVGVLERLGDLRGVLGNASIRVINACCISFERPIMRLMYVTLCKQPSPMAVESRQETRTNLSSPGTSLRPAIFCSNFGVDNAVKICPQIASTSIAASSFRGIASISSVTLNTALVEMMNQLS